MCIRDRAWSLRYFASDLLTDDPVSELGRPDECRELSDLSLTDEAGNAGTAGQAMLCWALELSGVLLVLVTARDDSGVP